MDTMAAVLRGMASCGKESMVFDWDKAAELIRRSGTHKASAGLAGDWEYTGGTIFDFGKPVPSDETYVFLASTWATPELEINGNTVDCYKMKSETPGWGSDTYWPDSALKILKG